MRYKISIQGSGIEQKIQIFFLSVEEYRLLNGPQCIACKSDIWPGINFIVNDCYLHPECATWTGAAIEYRDLPF